MPARGVPISDALTFGWETFKKNWLFLIGLFVAVGVITGVLESVDEYDAIEATYFEFVLTVITFLVNLVLELGVIAIMLKFRDGVEPEFVDLFNRAGLVLQFTVATVIYALMVLVGLVFFVVPGIYLGIRFYFYGYFIVEEEAGPFEALGKSAQLTEGVRLELFLFFLALLGINMLGILCFGFGVLVSVPVSALALAHVYRHLQGRLPGAESRVVKPA